MPFIFFVAIQFTKNYEVCYKSCKNYFYSKTYWYTSYTE